MIEAASTSNQSPGKAPEVLLENPSWIARAYRRLTLRSRPQASTLPELVFQGGAIAGDAGNESRPLVSTAGLRVAFITNLIPPYHKPVLDCVSRHYHALRILLSIPMESNRPWKIDWRGLDVVVQKTITLKGLWRHPKGFKESLAVHFPVDTIPQLTRFRPDVIISSEMGARTVLALLYRRLHPKSRLIVWAEVAESTEKGRGLARLLVRKILCRNVDAFLATGSSARRYLRSVGAPAERIFTLAYTTDVASFAAHPLNRAPEHARRLLFAGQLVERKGLAPFVEVLSRWAQAHADRTIEFQLAGDGPARAALEQLPLPANLKLTFLGVFQYGDLPSVYAKAGIFVLPTFADTWAVVVNEALAAGLPVLGSVYAQAVEELVEDGRNGWVFRTDYASEMTQAIDRMMNTPLDELDKMREAARATALSLSPEKVADLIDTAVEACTSGRRRATAPE